jgi:hypothetical protein
MAEYPRDDVEEDAHETEPGRSFLQSLPMGSSWREWGLDRLSLASRTSDLRSRRGAVVFSIREVWHGQSAGVAISHRQRLTVDRAGIHFEHEFEFRGRSTTFRE